MELKVSATSLALSAKAFRIPDFFPGFQPQSKIHHEKSMVSRDRTSTISQGWVGPPEYAALMDNA